ncbi:MAG: PQQ-like beta-propeller repeat protein [Lentisphaeraceae bacterium]|nr:PQQ-like beta-propeller repeat protein [Lentisphaeraceae bacterium]
MKTCLFISFLMISQIYAIDTWPRFRGLNGQGKSSSTLPKKLTKSNLKWSFALSGGGSSSPVVWGNKVFIQSANKNKSVTLYCIDSQSGKELWSHELNTGQYHTHKFNNQAASTPSLTENEVIVTWYDAAKQQGMLGVFDHSGKRLWEKMVGPFKGKHRCPGFTFKSNKTS